MAADERRVHKRVPFIQDVEIVGVGMRRCSDLSIGGMYLEAVSTFAEGEVLGIRFKLQNTDPQPIEVQVKVLYVHPSVGVGLSFVDLKPADRERIGRFVGI